MSTSKKRHRPPYPAEFKKQMVELVHAGRSPAELAEEFEPTAQAIRAWVRQAALDAGDRQDGLTTAERAELRQLRKELKEVKMERDILAEAAAWFARETGSVPSGRTKS